MHFDDLYSEYTTAGYDRQQSAGEPAKILICTTPRTAGHSYCQVLQQLGVGVPTEYFQWQYALPLMRRWSADDGLDLDQLYRQAPAYGRYLLEKRGANGTFAAKLFYENLPFARNALGDDDDNSFYVFLSRRNKVDQTISLLSMLHTGQPFDSQKVLAGIPTVSVLNDKVVRATAQHILDGEIRWRNYLNTLDAGRVAYVCYEDFITNQQENVFATVSPWLPGLELRSGSISESRRYAHDAELKASIRMQFGDYITRFWQDHT
jgi:LPS sulfotransferase NodH